VELELKSSSKEKNTIDNKLLEIIKNNQETKMNEIHEGSEKVFI